MSTLPTIRIGGEPSPESEPSQPAAPGSTSKLPPIRIGGVGAAPGQTAKIPPIVVPAAAASSDGEAPPAPTPAPEPTPTPAPEPTPAPAPAPAAAASPDGEAPPSPTPAPEAAPKLPPKPGLRPGLKLPPRAGGPVGKRRVPPKLGPGIKLPPKPGAPAATAPAAAGAAPTAPAPGAEAAGHRPAAPAAKPAAKATDAKKEPPKKDAAKKPDAGKKEDGAAKEGKKKRRFRPLALLPNLLVLLVAAVVSAGLRARSLEGGQAFRTPSGPTAGGAPEKTVEVSPSIRPVRPEAGSTFRIVHVARAAAVEEPAVEEPAVEPAAATEAPVEAPPPEPKKKEIVKRVPADLFEDAILETVKLLRTKSWEDARRSAVNSFSDIAMKEKKRGRECYAVIAALRSAESWDDLVADALCSAPKKREITVGNTTHVIVPTGTLPGAIVCKRYVNGRVLLNQSISLSEMSPKEKLRIVRGIRPDTSKPALYSRAFLELVHGSPKTFRAFIEKHPTIEEMKAFYVAYELKRMGDRNEP